MFLMALGYNNSVEVPLDLLVIKVNYPMNGVMAGLLAIGFLIGFIGAVLVNKKVQLNQYLAKRKTERLSKKQTNVPKADETPAASLE